MWWTEVSSYNHSDTHFYAFEQTRIHSKINFLNLSQLQQYKWQGSHVQLFIFYSRVWTKIFIPILSTKCMHTKDQVSIFRFTHHLYSCHFYNSMVSSLANVCKTLQKIEIHSEVVAWACNSNLRRSFFLYFCRKHETEESKRSRHHHQTQRQHANRYITNTLINITTILI